jgi:hypothetical protein
MRGRKAACVLTAILLFWQGPNGEYGRGAILLEQRRLSLLDRQRRLRREVERDGDELHNMQDRLYKKLQK